MLPRSDPSAAVATVGYNVSSSSSETAVLTMPDGAMCEDYSNEAAIRRCSIKNAMSWYEFINGELGREAPNGSLYVVTGCDKSTSWGIATVAEGSSSQALSLQFTAVKIGISANYNCSWSTTGGAIVRSSIATDLGEGVEQTQNQCLFVRGYKIMIREGLMAALAKPTNVESILDMKATSLLRQNKNHCPGVDTTGDSWRSRLSFGGGGSHREVADDWSAEMELDPHVVCVHILLMSPGSDSSLFTRTIIPQTP